MKTIFKNWYWFLLVLLIVLWRTIVGVFRKHQLGGSSSDVDAANKQLRMIDGERTLDDVDLANMADFLDKYLLQDFSEDEEEAIKVILVCQNAADWYGLVSAFGLRKPFGFMRDAISLPTALARYLSKDEYEFVSKYIKGIGGVL